MNMTKNILILSLGLGLVACDIDETVRLTDEEKAWVKECVMYSDHGYPLRVCMATAVRLRRLQAH